VILSSFKVSFWIAFTAALTLILGAAYTLWMYKRVIFGEAIREEVSDLKDIDTREGFILFLLASVVLIFGVWPAPVFDVMHVSIQQLIEHISQTKLL
jgi:NADH-quinone oxidoreductase subunit M